MMILKRIIVSKKRKKKKKEEGGMGLGGLRSVDTEEYPERGY